MKLIRSMMGADFRVEDLRYVDKDDYRRLYREAFWDRVHPIYRLYMQTKPEWDLQHLWFKISGKQSNLIIYKNHRKESECSIKNSL